MADVAGTGACQACGQILPPQHGRGRRRLYCAARCRDLARRQRARIARPGSPIVKINLTDADRHGYLDAVAAARELSVAAEAALQEAVDRARAAGQSWREIGQVLGTTRQAAFQRFGHPVDPRTGTPMTRGVSPGAIQLATAFLARFTAGRWEEVLGDLDRSMRARHDADRLASGWAQMVAMFGSYQSMGGVCPVPAGGGAAVDVRLDFEAGEAMLWVRFDGDGKVGGLRLHPLARDQDRKSHPQKREPRHMTDNDPLGPHSGRGGRS